MTHSDDNEYTAILFIKKKLVRASRDDKIPRREIYMEYVDYCDKNGLPKVSATRLYRNMRDMNFGECVIHGVSHFFAIMR